MSNQALAPRYRTRLTRRTTLGAGLALATGGVFAAPRSPLSASAPRPAAPPRQASPAAGTAADQAAAIMALARDALAKYALNAVIVRVTIDDQEVVTEALGESMTGVPATPDMHFRNGAVAISYMATLLLQLVDEQTVRLDDPIATWLPDLPNADRVTLGMLANMTAGYADYVQDKQFITDFYADPFRQWTTREQIAIGLATPPYFEPGTNWAYSHTNYVILGQALEAITSTPLATLMQEKILTPLGLTNTTGPTTAAIPEPVLHAFTSERRQALGIPPANRFYEESTYWNPSWTLAQGAIQTTNIYDMTTTAVAIGTGALLTPESHQAQVDPGLLGFGSPQSGCPTCATLNERYNYGIGVVLHGPWILQNPLFAGCGAVEGYLPSQKLAIAVATTYGEGSFDDQGNYKHGNGSQAIFSAIATYLAPDDTPSAAP